MAEENNDTNKPNPAEAFQKLLEKNNNDGVKLAAQLHDENFQLRSKMRDLKNNQPKDGAVVLSAEDAAKYKAFQDLGIEASKIKEAIDKLPTLETENKKLQKRDALRDVAKFGYKLDVLEEQMGKFPDAVFTIKKQKDAKDITKEVEVPFVSLDGKESSFEEFANQNLASYLPALKVSTEAHTNYIPGNPPPPPVHSPTTQDAIRNEIAAQQATGRYSL